MTITLATAITAFQGVQKLCAKEFPAKLSYRLSRLFQKLQSEMKVFESKKIDLLKKYGEPSPKNKRFLKVKEENEEVFEKEMTEMLEQPLEIEISKIPFEMFEDFKVEPKDLAAINDFLDEPKNETPKK